MGPVSGVTNGMLQVSDNDGAAAVAWPGGGHITIWPSGTGLGILRFQKSGVSDWGLIDRSTANTATGRILAINDANNGNDFMTFLGNGNVGIGTTTPQSLLHLASATPRINLFDTDAAISAANPCWSVRGQNDGYFRIQSSTDYAVFTNRLIMDANGNATIGSLAGTGTALVQADAAGTLSRSNLSGLIPPLMAMDMAHNFTPGTNNPNHCGIMAAYVPSTGKIWVISTNYTTNIENMDIPSGTVGCEWNIDGANNMVWVDFGDPNGAGTAYVISLAVAVSGFENNDQSSAMITVRMSDGELYLRSTTASTISCASLDATASWGSWVLMADPGE